MSIVQRPTGGPQFDDAFTDDWGTETAVPRPQAGVVARPATGVVARPVGVGV